MCALYNGVYIDIGLFLCHAVRQPDKVNEILDISLRSFDRRKFQREAKRLEFPDYLVAKLAGKTEEEVKALRKQYDITAAYKMVDTCAAEFAATTPYYYSVYGGENEAVETNDRKKVLVLGSGPIRIGQGIEFDRPE